MFYTTKIGNDMNSYMSNMVFFGTILLPEIFYK